MKSIVIIVSLFCLLASSVAAEQRPNILVSLANDIGEATDVADKEPAKFKELNDAWAAWNVQLMAPQWRREDSLTQDAGTTIAKGTRRGGGIEERFEQDDKNGDGKLDRNELPAALSDRLDVNKDAFVTREEAKGLSATGPGSGESN